MSTRNFYPLLVAALWLAWLIYWIAAAAGTKQTQRHESAASRMSYAIPTAFAAWLMSTQRLPWPMLFGRFLPRTLFAYWLGIALIVAGLTFTVWARRHLGANWSATVAVKHEHSLIRSGPYRWVRHPIYTGILAALLGTVLTQGQWRSLIALAIFIAAFVRKLALEEQWMREEFKDEYERYAAQVPALIPGLPAGSSPSSR